MAARGAGVVVGVRIAGRALQVAEDCPGRPRPGRVTEGLVALDGPPQLGAGFVVTPKLDERDR